jgi:hypothetical protein
VARISRPGTDPGTAWGNPLFKPPFSALARAFENLHLTELGFSETGGALRAFPPQTRVSAHSGFRKTTMRWAIGNLRGWIVTGVLSDIRAACRECPQRIGSRAPVLSDQECHHELPALPVVIDSRVGRANSSWLPAFPISGVGVLHGCTRSLQTISN